MNLTTTYIGMRLRNPLVPSASPLSDEIGNIRKMEDSGAAAVVLRSLFEEQLQQERDELEFHLTHGTESFAEALTYFPEPGDYRIGPEAYLEHIRKAKEAVDIPIIASLNGTSLGGWTEFARQIQEAGADALELNIYFIPTQANLSAAEIEQMYIDILQAVKSTVSIPVAVKLSPFFTNMMNMAKRLDAAGADALILFNRFYQPDIDIEELEVRPSIVLSNPFSLKVPMTWVGILYGRVNANLAATGGIWTEVDVIKMLMAGASVTQLCSCLLQNGIQYLATVETRLRQWMQAHEYDSVQQMQGSMSQQNCPDPSAFERAQYMRAIQSYRM